MRRYSIEDTTLQGIADAIREKDGTTDEIVVSDMSDRIRNMSIVPEKPFIDTSKMTTLEYFGAFNRFGEEDAEKIVVGDEVINCRYMFYKNTLLKNAPYFNTSNISVFQNMFNSCDYLESVPAYDTSNGVNFSSMFYQCYALTEVPFLNTSNGVDFSSMFSSATHIVTIEKLDLTKAEDISYLFRKCYALKTLKGLKFNGMLTSKMSANPFYQCSKLENITIEGTIKVDSNDLKLADCSKLTVDSMLSILNSLEDNTGESTQYTVTFGSSNVANLTDEQIDIALSKNINLA